MLIFQVLGVIAFLLSSVGCPWPKRVNYFSLGWFFLALAYVWPSLPALSR